jgi:anthranilate phosphoribosyltransferase
LIGVWDKELVPKMARALAKLGTTKSWIVNGNGLDEISLEGSTTVAEITGDSVDFRELRPMDFGIEPCLIEGIRCSDPVASSAMIRSVLNGEAVGTAAENIVALNAAAAIRLADPTMTKVEAVEAARESIRSGNARRKLEELARAIPA